MPTLQLSDQQVVELVKQLPPDSKRAALLALAKDATARREDRMQLAEAQIQRLCTDRGLDWKSMSEEEREAFIDDLVHGTTHAASSRVRVIIARCEKRICRGEL